MFLCKTCHDGKPGDKKKPPPCRIWKTFEGHPAGFSPVRCEGCGKSKLCVDCHG